MRKTLLASFTLLALAGSEAAAQACTSMPSFASGRMQLSGSGTFADAGNTFGAAFGLGSAAGMFGKVGVGTTSYDGVDLSSTSVGVAAGYQMAGGAKKNLALCPVASLGLGFGPDAGTAETSTRAIRLGLSVGTVLGQSEKMKFVPSAGLAFANDHAKITSPVGEVSGSESYALATLGVGFVFSQSFGITPSFNFPLGSDVADNSFALTGSFHFGGR